MNKLDNSTFVFLAGQDITRGVFDSHCINFLNKLYQNKTCLSNKVIMTFITNKVLSKEDTEIISRKEDYLKQLSHNYGFKLTIYHIKGKTISQIIKSYKVMCDILHNEKNIIIWAHNFYNGLIGTLLVKHFNRAYFHLDLKGVPPEEELYYSHDIWLIRYLKYLILKLAGRLSIANSHSISVVSNRFRQYLIKKYNLSNHKMLVVYPSVYDEKIFHVDVSLREEYRKKFNLKEDDKLIIFSGSMQNWQLPDNIFRLFKEIQKQNKNKLYKFIILTFQIEETVKYCDNYKLSEVLVTSAKERDLTGIYNAADIGIICRKDDLVNNVASPTKIAEYLATANSILLTNSIGDYGYFLQDKDYAIVKHNTEAFVQTKITELNQLKKPSIEELNTIGKLYGSEANIKKYSLLFNEIRLKIDSSST